MKRYTLLLTGSVHQNQTGLIANREVTKIRLAEYFCAIHTWLKTDVAAITYIDGGGFQLPDIFNDNRLERMAINYVHACKLRGKGFSEVLLIDYAIRHSRQLAKEMFVKCTGRLFVPQSQAIWEQLDFGIKRFHLGIANYRLAPNGDMADTRFFILSVPDFYQYIFENATKICDFSGYYFEHMMREVPEYCELPAYDVWGKAGWANNSITYDGYYPDALMEKYLRTAEEYLQDHYYCDYKFDL